MRRSARFHSSPRFAVVLAVAATVACVAAAPASAAKIKAGTVIAKSASGTTIQVTLSSSRTPSARKKPRSVKVKAAGKTVKLTRAGASAAAAYSSSWKSKAFTGAYAEKLNALNGKRVKVTVKSRSGSTTSNSKVTLQSSGGGGGGGGPIFASPGSDLVGNDAFNFFSKYLFDSAFSTCAAGPWPFCSFEERYLHCPNFAWGYERTAGGSGDASLNWSSFTVTGANAFADGSWAVQYTVTNSGAVYTWRVGANGVATGEYYFNGSAEPIGPVYWSQPAITWGYPNGAC